MSNQTNLSSDRHTREDPVHGTSDILDMAFLSPGLSFRDISFSIADDHMNSDHFPIQISFDKPLKQNTRLTEPRYRSDKTDDDLLHHTLKYSDITTQDELEELAIAVILCDIRPRDIFFSIADDHMDSDHFPIQISFDKPLKQNTRLTEPRYCFDKTDDDLLQNTLKYSDITTQDELEELAVILCDKLVKAVDTSTPKTYSGNNPKSPVCQAILDLIKESKRNLALGLGGCSITLRGSLHQIHHNRGVVKGRS